MGFRIEAPKQDGNARFNSLKVNLNENNSATRTVVADEQGNFYYGAGGTGGASGTSGTSGANGAPGANGANGTSGTSGADGASGTSGTSGTGFNTIADPLQGRVLLSDGSTNNASASLNLFYDTGSSVFQITGSTNISGSVVANQGFTGSLQGTSSWAENSISSSYAPNIYNSDGTLTSNRVIITNNNFLYVSSSRTAGTTFTVDHIQTQPNSTETSDIAMLLSYNLTASSATNQLVTRAFQLSVTNNLQGGGIVQNLRCFNLAAFVRTGASAGDLDLIYLERGAVTGTVTNYRAMRVANYLGTNRAGITFAAIGGTNATYLNLGSIVIPSGFWGVYQSEATYNNYFNGNVSIKTSLSNLANLQVNGNVWALSYTGSLLGTASFATTASYALNAPTGSAFPFSGSAVITGSLLISGSPATSYSLDIDGLSRTTTLHVQNLKNQVNGNIDAFVVGNPGDAGYQKLSIFPGGSPYSTVLQTSGDGGGSRDMLLSAFGPGGQIHLGTSSTNRWYITGTYNSLGAGHFLPVGDGLYNIGDPTAKVNNYYGVRNYISNLLVVSGSAVITGSAGITGSLSISGSGLKIENSTLLGNNGGQIEIKQTGANSAYIGIQGAGWNALGMWGVNRFTTTSTPDLRILGTGEVNVTNRLLVNTTAQSSYLLDVNGLSNISGRLDVTGSINVTGSITGSLLANEATISGFSIGISSGVGNSNYITKNIATTIALANSSTSGASALLAGTNASPISRVIAMGDGSILMLPSTGVIVGGITYGGYGFDVQGNARITNGLNVTGSVIASQGFTGSLFGTSSWAINSITASSADNFTVRGTLTAQTIVAQVITSSTDFVTGSTRFGSLISNTHQFTGSVSVTGSFLVSGSSRFTGDATNNAIYVSSGKRINFDNREVSIGEQSTGSYEGVAIGSFIKANTGTVVLGKNCNSATYNRVFMVGWNTSEVSATSNNTLAIYGTNTSGIGIFGETSNIINSTEIAILASAVGAGIEGNVAIGRQAYASGSYAIALGPFAEAGISEFVAGSRDKPVTNVYFGGGNQSISRGAGTGVAYTINGSGANGTDFAGGNITIAGGKGTGTGTSGDIILSTATPTTTGTTLQSLTQRVWIKGNTGRVGIDNTSPSTILTVGNTTTDNSGITVLSTDSSTNYDILTGQRLYPRIRLIDSNPGGGSTFQMWNLGNQLRFGTNAGSGDTSAININAGNAASVIFNGDVGIKQPSPSYTLDVTGTIRATGDVIAFSDARVKDNVETIENALEKVNALRGVSYVRKDTDDKSRKLGVIAQELIPIIPEVVSKDQHGNYSVSYGNMVGLLIEAIKEQQKQIDELKYLLKNK